MTINFLMQKVESRKEFCLLFDSRYSWDDFAAFWLIQNQWTICLHHRCISVSTPCATAWATSFYVRPGMSFGQLAYSLGCFGFSSRFRGSGPNFARMADSCTILGLPLPDVFQTLQRRFCNSCSSWQFLFSMLLPLSRSLPMHVFLIFLLTVFFGNFEIVFLLLLLQWQWCVK